MYRLYNEDETVVLPNGKSYTSKDLKDAGGYDMLFSLPCAIEIDGGVMVSYQPVSALANQYGVPYEGDYSEVVSSVNAMIEKSRKSRVASFSVNRAAQIIASSFTDDQAIEVPDLYPEFELNHQYKKDDRFQYGQGLYKVNQDHTSQEQWIPGTEGTESLYTNLMLDDDGNYIWKQPTGAHDAYNTGDIVKYNDTLYKSLIDGNVWSPDSYPQGWEKVEEGGSSTVTPPTTGGESGTGDTSYPDFVKPTGSHDAYKKGDIVRYNGKLYQSTIDSNVYSPDEYPQGWTEYTES